MLQIIKAHYVKSEVAGQADISLRVKQDSWYLSQVYPLFLSLLVFLTSLIRTWTLVDPQETEQSTVILAQKLDLLEFGSRGWWVVPGRAWRRWPLGGRDNASGRKGVNGSRSLVSGVICGYRSWLWDCSRIFQHSHLAILIIS